MFLFRIILPWHQLVLILVYKVLLLLILLLEEVKQFFMIIYSMLISLTILIDDLCSYIILRLILIVLQIWSGSCLKLTTLQLQITDIIVQIINAVLIQLLKYISCIILFQQVKLFWQRFQSSRLTHRFTISRIIIRF